MKKKHSNVAAGTGIHEKIKQDGWSITFNVIERNEIEWQGGFRTPELKGNLLRSLEFMWIPVGKLWSISGSVMKLKILNFENIPIVKC